MGKRLFDVIVSVLALVVFFPVLLLAFIGIRLSSPGPIIYKAARIGWKGELFMMHKLRTMHVSHRSNESVITGAQDFRVYPLGVWLRRLKIDELPQLYDVLRGKMSITGPRPEDPKIVRHFYLPKHLETLAAIPGLASPGSIYNYTHGERLLTGEDPERAYGEKLLPVKLALDVVYVRHASLLYDITIIGRAIWVILLMAFGKRMFPDPPEMREAVELMNSLTSGKSKNVSERSKHRTL